MTPASLPALRSLRQTKGLTLRELSQMADVDISTIHRAEKANTWPSRDRTCRRLLTALGLAWPEGGVP